MARTAPEQAELDSPAGEQAEMALERVRKRLATHYHFRHCYGRYRLEFQRGRLIIHGRVPTYYHKQMLQEALRNTEGIERIDNRVEVDVDSAPSRLPDAQ
jgi:hypothetical protein